MSILVDNDILRAIEAGVIKIDPFDRACLGTNSYDVHLAETLLTYKNRDWPSVLPDRSVSVFYGGLDCRAENLTVPSTIQPAGHWLLPGELYLASTIEYTESHVHVPMLNGKSSLGRLGLSIHVTAGSGDVGFCNHWTLEMTVVRPLRIYAGMPIGQLLWFEASGVPLRPYNKKPDAKYNERDAQPGVSQMHRNFK